MEVTSNIWGTKFKQTGLAPFLPEDLGNVLYKTSLLHLQPRQMTITITGLNTVNQPLSRDPNFTPAGHYDEEGDCRSSKYQRTENTEKYVQTIIGVIYNIEFTLEC